MKFGFCHKDVVLELTLKSLSVFDYSREEPTSMVMPQAEEDFQHEDFDLFDEMVDERSAGGTSIGTYQSRISNLIGQSSMSRAIREKNTGNVRRMSLAQQDADYFGMV
jgi:hypothetical protein